MKRIIFAISALAVIAGLSASCQKEMAPDNTSVTVNSVLTVTATIADNGTKVSYAEDVTTHALTPTWVVDDIIIGFDGSDNTYGYKVTAVNDGVATLARITDDGDYKGTATSDPADGATMYMIYAPGYKPGNINTTDKSLTVSLASQSKDVVPALMMAQATVSNSSLNLAFKNQTAIIGIKTPTMATESKTYTGIAVSGAGINTEVKFGLNASSQLEATYQTPGTIVKAVDFTSGTDNTTSATIYVVACPLETAADLTFTASNGEKFKKNAKTMVTGQYYYMTPVFEAPVALSGKFSVGPNTTDIVCFSPGNLRCNPVGTPGNYTSGVWGFFDNQYDRGPTAYNSGHDKEISLFTWGYNAEKSIVPDGSAFDNVSITEGNLSQDQDWGSQIGDGSTWRTLTNEEWKYLFNTRTASTVNGKNDARYAKAKVNNKAGIILLPDEYSHPSGVTALKNINTNDAEYGDNNYNVTEWTSLENAGAVFLPAAGYRFGSDVRDVVDCGHYWSSFVSDSHNGAYLVQFLNWDFFVGNPFGRGDGNSVRLITESN